MQMSPHLVFGQVHHKPAMKTILRFGLLVQSIAVSKIPSAVVCLLGTVCMHLQEVEGGGVQEEEGHEVQGPDDLVHKGLPAQVPQWHAIVAVVYEVHQRHRC